MSGTKKKKKKSDASGGEYEVGYGKPPKQTRFRPGHSGNPKGRPKGVRNFKMDVQATLRAPVRLTREGRAHRVSTQEAALLRLREKALGGDVRALERLLALARDYNNENLPAVAGLSGDDAKLLELYNARVLRGAAVTPTPASDSSESPGQTNAATSPARSEAIPTRKHSSKRIRRYKP